MEPPPILTKKKTTKSGKSKSKTRKSKS